jgi:hypothetical protein
MQRLDGHAGGDTSGSPANDRGDGSQSSRRHAFESWVFHPFLLGVYPILALFAQNAREVRVADPLRVGALVLAGTASFWLVLTLLLKDGRKSGLIASMAVAAFFGFSVIVSALESLLTRLSQFWVRSNVTVHPTAVLLPEVLLLVGLAYYIVVKVRTAKSATVFLNLFSVILIVIPTYGVISVKAGTLGRPRREPTAFPLEAPAGSAALPDIYYIILDGYARTDIMKANFDYDNSPFLDRLERNGFFISRHSIANYCQTRLCLSASLNAVYLDDLVKGMGPDQTELSDLIGRSNVMASLRPLGYKFVTFATGFDATEHPSADLYLSPFPYSSGFERMVIDATPLGVLWPSSTRLAPATRSRQLTSFVLDHLADVAKNRAPTFTFAHILCPHPPFVFGENGEDVSARFRKYSLGDGDRSVGRFRDPADFSRAYRGQSAFITQRIEQTIAAILAASPAPPIIILQSDHGSELNLDIQYVDHSDFKERMSILNAYYFPGRQYDALHDGISPVNSFRVIFNTYFGARLKLLPDRSFFSTWVEPYHFIDVTEAVRLDGDPIP